MERHERWERAKQKRREEAEAARPMRDGRRLKFWETKTPQELEQMRAELVEAYDIVSNLVAEMRTPEAIAEAEARKAEFQKLCQELNEAISEAEERLARDYPGCQAMVPVHDAEEHDEWWLFFDGQHLWWSDSPRTNRWDRILRGSLRIRTNLPPALSALRSALQARRWMMPPKLCTAPKDPGCTFIPRRTMPTWEIIGLSNPRNKGRSVKVAKPEMDK